MSGHGWVTPNPDGSKARCGGPALCGACAREKAAAEAAIAATLNDASSGKQQGGSGPTETVRRAAALMRERAEVATPGPWDHMCLGSEGCLVLRKHGTIRERGRGRVARFGQKEWEADHADAAFVASMSPLVALAVAGWLDAEAAIAEHRLPDDSGSIHPALRVAHAYLGEPT